LKVSLISLKSLKSCEIFFIEYGHVGYTKNPYLMQIQIKSTYLSDKMHLKKGLKCDEKLTTGPLYKVESALIQNISIWVHFATKVSLVYFNFREMRNFLYPLRPTSKEKFW
jgi:hypothetical protein